LIAAVAAGVASAGTTGRHPTARTLFGATTPQATKDAAFDDAVGDAPFGADNRRVVVLNDTNGRSSSASRAVTLRPDPARMVTTKNANYGRLDLDREAMRRSRVRE
jgi:hypothetical protein